MADVFKRSAVHGIWKIMKSQMTIWYKDKECFKKKKKDTEISQGFHQLEY